MGGVDMDNRLDVEVPLDFFNPEKSEGTKNPKAREHMAKVAQFSAGGLTALEYAEKALVDENTAYRVLQEAVTEGKMKTETRETEGRGEHPTVYTVDRPVGT
jgi:hypothetical protein